MPTYRFGISALSKKYKDKAYKEEFLLDKNTGEALVRTSEGDFMSYDVLTRSKMHINSVIQAAEAKTIAGNMYAVDVSSLGELPVTLTQNTLNLTLNEQINMTQINFNKFMLSLDIDTLLLSDGELSNKRYDPLIVMEYTPSIDLSLLPPPEEGEDTTPPEGEEPKEITVSKITCEPIILSEFNEKVFELKDTDGELLPKAIVTGVNINSLVIDTSNLESANGEKYRTILHEIICVFS